MHAVSTNQIADILKFSDNALYCPDLRIIVFEPYKTSLVCFFNITFCFETKHPNILIERSYYKSRNVLI